MGNADEFFRAGCDLARLIPGAEKPDADRYAALAVETLRQAREARLEDFDARLRSSKALDPIRGRSDFQDLTRPGPGPRNKS